MKTVMNVALTLATMVIVGIVGVLLLSGVSFAKTVHQAKDGHYYMRTYHGTVQCSDASCSNATQQTSSVGHSTKHNHSTRHTSGNSSRHTHHTVNNGKESNQQDINVRSNGNTFNVSGSNITITINGNDNTINF